MGSPHITQERCSSLGANLAIVSLPSVRHPYEAKQIDLGGRDFRKPCHNVIVEVYSVQLVESCVEAVQHLQLGMCPVHVQTQMMPERSGVVKPGAR